MRDPRRPSTFGRRTALLGSAGLLLGSAGLAAGCGVREPAVGRFVPEGEPVPLPEIPGPTDATLTELEGMLVAQRGKPVVLNMWASWCVPCRAETPILERAHESNGDDVVFIGVASQDRRSDAVAFMDEFGVRYVNLFDVGNALPTRLQARGFPTTVALGPDGRVEASSYGGLTEQRLAAMIQAARR